MIWHEVWRRHCWSLFPLFYKAQMTFHASHPINSCWLSHIHNIPSPLSAKASRVVVYLCIFYFSMISAWIYVPICNFNLQNILAPRTVRLRILCRNLFNQYNSHTVIVVLIFSQRQGPPCPVHEELVGLHDNSSDEGAELRRPGVLALVTQSVEGARGVSLNTGQPRLIPGQMEMI